MAGITTKIWDQLSNIINDSNTILLSTHFNADGDGLGDPNDETLSCGVPTGYVEDCTDVNDECFTNIIDECDICDGDGYENDCSGNFTLHNIDPSIAASSVKAIDIYGDVDLDVVATTRDGDAIVRYENK